MATDSAKWKCLALLSYALGGIKVLGSAVAVLFIPDCAKTAAYIYPAISAFIGASILARTARLDKLAKTKASSEAPQPTAAAAAAPESATTTVDESAESDELLPDSAVP